MQQKNAIIFIVLLLITIGTGLGFWYFFAQPQGGTIAQTPQSQTNQNFFPFGTNQKPPATQTQDQTTATSTGEVPVIRHISTDPVAGFTVIEKKGQAPIVRYMEAATGHLFDAPVDSVTVSRISNTTIPRVREAVFANSGDTVIARYLRDDGETIATFSAKLNRSTTTSEGELRGAFLTDNISTASVSLSGTKLFYMVPAGNGTEGYVSNTDGTKKTKVFSSPLREWVSQWLNDSSILIGTKASYGVNGAIETVNSQSGESAVVALGGQITALGKNSMVILQTNGLVSSLDLKTGKNNPIPLGTFPEKCAVNDKGTEALCGVPIVINERDYPDNWYQGLTGFSDEIWTLDTKSGQTNLISDLRAAGEPLDITSLKTTTDGKYAIFINNLDGTLWSVRR